MSIPEAYASNEALCRRLRRQNARLATTPTANGQAFQRLDWIAKLRARRQFTAARAMLATLNSRYDA